MRQSFKQYDPPARQAVLDQLPRDLESQKMRAQETDALLAETAPDW